MKMEFDSPEVAKAKEFWRRVNVDHVFSELTGYLNKVRDMIKSDAATDREYVWSMTMVVESEILPLDNDIEEVIIKSAPTQIVCSLPTVNEGAESKCEAGNLKLEWSSRKKGEEFGSDTHLVPAFPPFSEDPTGFVIAPLAVQPPFHPHDCTRACLPNLPPSIDLFLGENPLKVPILCQFQRLNAMPDESEEAEPDVVYKAPCGRAMRGPDDVLHFLRETHSDGILRLDNFSFNSSVVLARSCDLAVGGLLEADLSKGVELTPVQLYNEVDGERPSDFRYRKDRWPHGCFVGPTPTYSACCDCQDGCVDVARCDCLQLTLRSAEAAALGHADTLVPYTHRRLLHPVPSGIYECGPWCGCNWDRCQNHLVQDGLRVRLQVFRTQDCGWGVRCRDDLDSGTFVCTYTGILLWAGPTASSFLSKRKREELPSDDEVEVIEEWKMPPEELGTQLDASCPPPPTSHVPIIQGPASLSPLVLDKESRKVTDNGTRTIPRKGELKETGVSPTPCAVHGDVDAGRCKGLWEDSEEHLFYMDATEEGNVARFLNHSCQPNLFVQNVFVESHNRTYPTVAFFTSREVKAGTELTWKYSYKPGSLPEQEVPCQCGSESCQGAII
ncbi:histone-lysine N-methyltransferase SETDB2 isoform X1 [Brienomyrus brachyistius]|uniref:histone-lysine N-methyltransferase SETDB2 isoform X1 n=1 Tax=Brienomyrus brachyistius TaxID=42636 RepID=UPI0020B225BC|nr:histone-lysine N-methyltransferase SETDB2 isoform X1 [Brienomyrus brachyistius]